MAGSWCPQSAAAGCRPTAMTQLAKSTPRRLVEDHEAGPVHQRACEQQTPALAPGQLRSADVPLRGEPEGPDHLLNAALDLVLVHAEVAAVVLEGLAHGQEAVEVDVLLGQHHRPRAPAWREPARHEHLAIRQPRRCTRADSVVCRRSWDQEDRRTRRVDSRLKSARHVPIVVCFVRPAVEAGGRPEHPIETSDGVW